MQGDVTPEVLADGLARHLQDDHGRVELSQGFDGRDVDGEDVRRVDA